MAMLHARRCAAAMAAGLAAFTCACAWAGIRVVDDTGTPIELPVPAARVVSLAPHATELLFAAGAGGRLVGATDYSDYPDAAKAIPRVGSSSRVDVERIAGLRPDLIVAWQSGNPGTALERLRRLGIPVYVSEPRTFADIARTLIDLGALAGSADVARASADAFRARAAALRERYADRSAVTLFWQVWARPLLTVGGRHLIGEAIRSCGGRNVFAQLAPLVPAVGIEAVVDADPEAIVTTGTDASAGHDDGLDAWRRLKRLRATARDNLIVLDADTIHRGSPRILDGAAALCRALDDVRARRSR
jgi:iron complex transport system substrate-binding protein